MGIVTCVQAIVLCQIYRARVPFHYSLGTPYPSVIPFYKLIAKHLYLPYCVLSSILQLSPLPGLQSLQSSQYLNEDMGI
jgi:hypothetical protein